MAIERLKSWTIDFHFRFRGCLVKWHVLQRAGGEGGGGGERGVGGGGGGEGGGGEGGGAKINVMQNIMIIFGFRWILLIKKVKIKKKAPS